MASSLGQAYVEVEANADKVGPELEARFTAALQTIVRSAEGSFEEIGDDSAEAARLIAEAFEEKADVAASAVNGISESADTDGLVSQFDTAAGEIAGSVEGAAEEAQSALEGIDPGDPFDGLADSAGAAAEESATALSSGLEDTGAAAAATAEGEAAGEGFASGIESKEGRVREVAGKVALAASAAIAAAGGVALAAAMTMDDASDTIRIATGASGAELDGLMGTFENLSRNVPANMDDVATAVATLNQRMGLTGPALEGLAGQVLQLGNLQGAAVDVDSLTSSLAIFGVQGDQAGGVLDTLFQVSQATGVGVNDLTGTLAKSGAQLTGLGFSITDAAALLGTLDKAGIDSSAAAGTLGRSLVSLAKDGEDPQEAFRRVTDEIGGFIQSGDQAAALDLASQVFGTRGAAQMVAALQSGALNLDNLTASAGLSGDTIMGIADETADFPELWQKFQNSATLALAPLGERLFPLIADGIGYLTQGLGWAVNAAVELGDWINGTGIPALQAFSGWVQDNATTIAVIAGVIAAIFIPHLVALGVNYVITQAKAVASWTTQKAQAIAGAATHSWAILRMIAGWVTLAATTVAQGAVIVARWVWMGIQAGASAAVTAAAWVAAQIRTVASLAVMAAGFVAQGAAMLASQAVTVAGVVAGWVVMGAQSLLNAARIAAAWLIAMGPIAIVIAAVIGLVALIVANWETIRDFTIGVFQAIWGFIVGVWNAIFGAIKTALGWIADGISFYVNLWWTVISTVVGAIVGWVVGAWNGLVQGVSAALNWVAGFISGIWNGIWNTVTSVVGRIVGWVVGAWQGMVSGIQGAFSGVAGFFSGIFDGIGSGIRSAINAVLRVINTGINFINDKLIDTANQVPFVDIPHIPQIPLLAEGAIIDRPTLAVIGEDGPEVVLPLSARRASRRAALMDEAGLGGDGPAAGLQVTYAPQLTVPRSASAAEVSAIVQKDLGRSLRMGLLDGGLGSYEEAS